ncbi:MAG: hypothetical protein O2822_02105 [Chloroflexi bacterium]|nr:hypothetical protein [Chloroflexota bacterium]
MTPSDGARITSVPEQEGTLPYFLARPPRGERVSGLIVVVHGQSRGARPLIEAFAGKCTARGYAILAPVFDRTRYCGYQRLAGVVGPTAAGDALRRTTTEAGRSTSVEHPGIALVGFSAGAQFAHRFALAHPDHVTHLVVAAAGWYTMPDAGLAYPQGLAASNMMPDGWADLDAFLRLPIRVLVGDRDVTRDANLNTSPAVDELQGRHRVERAQRWVRAVRAAAETRGLPSNVALELLPRTAHSATEAIARGGLVGRTLKFVGA